MALLTKTETKAAWTPTAANATTLPNNETRVNLSFVAETPTGLGADYANFTERVEAAARASDAFGKLDILRNQANEAAAQLAATDYEINTMKGAIREALAVGANTDQYDERLDLATVKRTRLESRIETLDSMLAGAKRTAKVEMEQIIADLNRQAIQGTEADYQSLRDRIAAKIQPELVELARMGAFSTALQQSEALTDRIIKQTVGDVPRAKHVNKFATGTFVNEVPCTCAKGRAEPRMEITGSCNGVEGLEVKLRCTQCKTIRTHLYKNGKWAGPGCL